MTAVGNGPSGADTAEFKSECVRSLQDSITLMDLMFNWYFVCLYVKNVLFFFMTQGRFS